MIEHCLYGVTVCSEFPFFEQPEPKGAAAPGEHSPLELRASVETSAVNELSECTMFGKTHGRDILLHTDRPLARALRVEQVGARLLSWEFNLGA